MTDRRIDGAGAGRSRLWRVREFARAGAMLALFAAQAGALAPVKNKPADKEKAAAKEPAGMLRIPLSSMGYQPLQQNFLVTGSSLLTVHFVDQDHLLVTFGVRRLMKREAADSASDDDRVVGANLVELPSGKVLAHAEWRLHDRSQYLWPLGHGRFVLRVRDRLTMIAPGASHGAEDAFREYPLPALEGHVVAVLTSPDEDLLTVETTRYAIRSGGTSEGFSFDPAPVEISFFRLSGQGPAADDLAVTSAGKIRTQKALVLPITAAGRLETIQDGKAGWLFNFNEHAGKVDQLAGFQTSCSPRTTLVGRGQFVALGCHGSASAVVFGGFNMKGEQMWQQSFDDSQVAPVFAFAPAGGRFALGRTLVSGEIDPDIALPPSSVIGQEVRVYQTYSGKQLFKIDCSPVERAGQNFALSQDGLRLAVVRETMVHHPATKDFAAYDQNEAAVEVYTLPALSKEDQAAVNEAQKLAPADTGARIDLALARSSAPKQKMEPPEPPSPVAVAAPGETVSSSLSAAAIEAQGSAAASRDDPATAAAGTMQEGDVQPSGPRQRPTLYGPGESAAKKP